MLSLIDAPLDKPLKIIQFLGGHGMRRKLMSLGIHIGDVIEVDSRSPFGGPVLIKSLTNNTTVALGRGIARKIMVTVINE
ncbi:ferrous iron transport protein A [Candidatus Aminicenantes bacterium AC-335-B20]|jgi:Fe2+ transport system protein FeoA|nr:ferrous iron transport protein A [SCandidatus Aminicenantes bacterium Aminicenantia_JdfR_composite]MCP2599247.1 ferrous iron transport protein A [Candidatus Aminicenantes bacterium AC-335-B20]MCP2605783.1 ferrous iron transport protein A [Candidatus Aminicenantes bacterium AC-335-O07]MCP2618655.1 ferrous iron transport protein A [Candidatus Aminicenantes bacterium AC-335-A11]